MFRFGAYELDEQAGELRRDGAPVEIQPKPYELLCTLVRERARIVSHDELTAELWPDTVVAPSSLNKAVSLARRAIGDTGQGRLIRSFSKRGYRFVAEGIDVVPERAAAQAASAPPAGTRPFVGREEALAFLEAASRRTTDRRGGVVLVTGPAGIGKTRLVDVWQAERRQAGDTVVVGRARDDEGVPAFWLWAQILRRLLENETTRAEVLALAGHSGELGALMPELASEGPATATDQSRFLFFDAVTRALRRCAEARPLVVVLEDLQWAGSPSLRLLEHLAFEIADAPILLVATVRDARSADDDVERTLSLLRAEAHCESLPLQGLSRGAVAAWLEQQLGAVVPVELTSELFARTEGIPLFLGEAVRLIEARGDPRDPAALARIALAGAAPSGTRIEWIERAFETLDPHVRELLVIAGTIGREFSLHRVAAVAKTARGDVLDALEAAEAAGIVEAPANPADIWRFAHALFQDAALTGQSRGARASLHARVAAEIESFQGEQADLFAAELAHHHHQSLAVGDPERAYYWAARAARRAHQGLAFEQESEHHQQALAALALFERPAPEIRLETLLARIESDRLSGAREQRRQSALEAMELARQLSEPRALARGAIGLVDVAEWSMVDEVGERALAEAARALPNDGSVEHVQLMTRIAHLAIGQSREQAEPIARKAVTHARACEEPRVLIESIYNLMYAIAGPDDLAEREALTREAVAVCGRGPVPDVMIIALLDAASDKLMRGDATGSYALRDLARRVGNEAWTPSMAWHMEVFEAGREAMEGQLAESERSRSRAAATGRRIAHPFAISCAVTQQVEALRDAGDFAGAARVTSKMLRRPIRDVQWLRGILGQMQLAMGDPVGARDQLERLAANDFADMARHIRWLKNILEAASLCADLEDAERSETLTRILEPYADLHAVLPMVVAYGGPVRGTLARLQAVRGEVEASLASFDAAIAACAALGARPARVRLLAHRGAASERCGASQEAKECFAEARAEAERLGMIGLEAALRAGRARI